MFNSQLNRQLVIYNGCSSFSKATGLELKVDKLIWPAELHQLLIQAANRLIIANNNISKSKMIIIWAKKSWRRYLISQIDLSHCFKQLIRWIRWKTLVSVICVEFTFASNTLIDGLTIFGLFRNKFVHRSESSHQFHKNNYHMVQDWGTSEI